MRGVNIEGRSQKKFSVSTSAAASGVLEPGTYDCWCDVDCWIAVSAAPATGLTSDTGYFIAAGNVVAVQISQAGLKIGAIAGGSGTFRFHQVGT